MATANEWWRNPISAQNQPQGAANPQQAATTQALGSGGGAKRTAWGFTSRGGGKGELGYTPQDYAGDYQNMEGFNMDKVDLNHPDADSMKYVFARAAKGLAPGSGSLDEIISRLQGQGLNAKRVGPDSIDFGLGEGAMDVIRGGTDATGYHGWQWIPGAGGEGNAFNMGGGTAGGPEYSDQGVNAGEYPTQGEPGLGAEGGTDEERAALAQALAQKQGKGLGQIGSF